MADGPSRTNPAHVARLLDDLARPAVAEAEILRMGTAAVPALVGYLEGDPQSVPDGKRLAIQLLGLIGGEEALQGLRRFMTSSNPRDLDPVLAWSQRMARNEAARQLATVWGAEGLTDFLTAYRHHHLPAAAEVLGRFQVLEGVPDLIGALESDLEAEPAFEALSRFGPAAEDRLREALSSPHRHPSGSETRPSLQRRMRLAMLLGVPGRTGALEDLRQRLGESHPALRAAAALALLRVDPETCGEACLAALLEGGLSPDPWLRVRCREEALGAGPQALEPACRLLQSEATQDLYGRSIPLDLEARAWLATVALARLRTPEDLNRLAEWAGSEALAAGLARMETALPPVAGALARHPDPRVRSALARWFRVSSDPASLEGLARLLGDPSRAVRAETRHQVARWLASDPRNFWESWRGLRASLGWRVRLTVRWIGLRHHLRP